MKHNWHKHWPAGVLGITYAVGTVGLSQPEWRPLFLTLTPVQLLLTVGLALAAQRSHLTRSQQAAWALGIAVAAWALEVAGVHSGVLFGQYTYGTPFGLQVLEVPLLIGINWLFLVACCSALALRVTHHQAGAVALAAATMTALDWVMEPVAQALGFWFWRGGTIPLQNYAMWFAASAVLCWLYIRHVRPTNRLAAWVLACQFGFFLLLRLLLNQEPDPFD